MVDDATRVVPDGSQGDDGEGADRLLRIGPFRLLERLGEGGMGIVYLAERKAPVVQRVALKVIKSDRLDKTYRARFAMEQQALARMEHPHVARLLDAGDDDGQSWFAMEYVPGLPLTDYCRQHRLPLEQRLGLFRQICDGVQHAHMKGILHRDLKPANIMVHEVDGRPLAKIIDFGLAQPVDPLQIRPTLHEAMRQVVGTFAYMSPEQAGRHEGDLDTRTDVYSLGVVLYEMLTGELPLDLDELDRRGVAFLGAMLRDRDPVAPSTRLSTLGPRLDAVAVERRTTPHRLRTFVRGELDWVTMKALAPDRQHRYATVRDLGREIERVLAHEPVEAGPPGPGYVLRKWLRRHVRAVALGAAALVVGFGVLGLEVAHARATARLEREARLAQQPLTGKGLLARHEDFGLAERCEPLVRGWLAQVGELLDDEAAQRERLGRADDPLGREYLDETLPALRAAADEARGLLADIEWVRSEMRAAAEAWQRCIAEIVADERYGIAALEPQFGLVPLGRDPGSRLFEFEVLDNREHRHGLPDTRVTRATTGEATDRLELTPTSDVVLVLLPGGTFMMGTGEPMHEWIDPQVAKAEAPRHAVTVRPFFLGKFEVTETQYSPFEQDDPSYWNQKTYAKAQHDLIEAGRGDRVRSALVWKRGLPVNDVSWIAANRRALQLGLRLPTEAEWEYAARAGTTGPWSCPADEAELRRHANLVDASPDRQVPVRVGLDTVFTASDGIEPPAPVGVFEPNGFGLHDMHGNVAEWCADPLLDYDAARLAESPATPTKRVVRGGSYRSDLQDSRSARRRQLSMSSSTMDIGFRVARDLTGFRLRPR